MPWVPTKKSIKAILATEIIFFGKDRLIPWLKNKDFLFMSSFSQIVSRYFELVYFGLKQCQNLYPEQEQINLNGKLQDVLSKNPDGIASTWKSKPGDITAMLVPVNSYTGSSGAECRDYYSIYSVKGRIRKNARSVCKQPEGRWQRVD